VSAHAPFLAIHVAAGTTGLLLGPVAMLAPKRPGTHTRVGEVYHWTVFTLFCSAVALAILNWDEVWWLSLVGAGSYAFALMGYLAAKRRPRGWLGPHISGQGGSYIAMVSAFMVVNWEALTGTPGFRSPLPWVLPTIVGSPIIAWVISQVAHGKRPKRARRASAAT
jgi:hypothetical protein